MTITTSSSIINVCYMASEKKNCFLSSVSILSILCITYGYIPCASTALYALLKAIQLTVYCMYIFCKMITYIPNKKMYSNFFINNILTE